MSKSGAIIACALIAALALAVGAGDPYVIDVVALYSLMTALAVISGVGALRRTNDWLAPPILYAMAWTIYSIRSLQIMLDWESRYISGRDELHPLLVQSLVLVALSVVSFTIAFARTCGADRSGDAPLPAPGKRPSLLLPVVMGLAAVGFVALFGLLSMRGGVAGYLDALATRRYVLTGNQFLLVLAQSLPASALILLIAGGRLSRWQSLLTYSYAGGTVLAVLLLGSRSQALTWILTFLVARVPQLRHPWNARRVVGAALLASTLIVGSVAFETARAETARGDFSASTEDFGSPLSVIAAEARSRQRTDRFVRVLQVVPERVNFAYFSTYSRVATTLIPRRLWPEKPPLAEASEYAADAFGWRDSSYSTLPGGVIADYYLQLGAIGVGALSFLNGHVIGRLYARYRRGSRLWVAVYCVALPSIGLGINNLQIMAFVTRIPIVVVPLALILGSMRPDDVGPSPGRRSEDEGRSPQQPRASGRADALGA